MQKLHILVVDDDAAIIKLLHKSLIIEGWDVISATNGVEALQVVEATTIDLVVLDINMPNMNGFEVCHRLRDWGQMAIIMLSARERTEDKVRCLASGADDYITKPFAVDELIARIKSVIRRIQGNRSKPVQPSFTLGNIKIDFTQRRITVGDTEFKLTPTEHALLYELISNKGKILSHQHLLSTVWGQEYCQEREYLRVFIGHLRSKLEYDESNPRYIVTVPGVGYQFVDKS